jgi:hypothetical protein
MHSGHVMSTYPSLYQHTSISFAKLFKILKLSLVFRIRVECFQANPALVYIVYAYRIKLETNYLNTFRNSPLSKKFKT